MKLTQLSAFVFSGLILCGVPVMQACSTTQPVSEQVSDSSITTRVKAQYMGDSAVTSRDISVETSEGVVYLTGRVQTQSEKTEAERIARNTTGVKNVVNNLKVGNND